MLLLIDMKKLSKNVKVVRELKSGEVNVFVCIPFARRLSGGLGLNVPKPLTSIIKI